MIVERPVRGVIGFKSPRKELTVTMSRKKTIKNVHDMTQGLMNCLLNNERNMWTEEAQERKCEERREEEDMP